MFQAEKEKAREHLTCGEDGQREVVGEKTLQIGCGSDHHLKQDWRVIKREETYLQIILPRDLL